MTPERMKDLTTVGRTELLKMVKRLEHDLDSRKWAERELEVERDTMRDTLTRAQASNTALLERARKAEAERHAITVAEPDSDAYYEAVASYMALQADVERLRVRAADLEAERKATDDHSLECGRHSDCDCGWPHVALSKREGEGT